MYEFEDQTVLNNTFKLNKEIKQELLNNFRNSLTGNVVVTVYNNPSTKPTTRRGGVASGGDDVSAIIIDTFNYGYAVSAAEKTIALPEVDVTLEDGFYLFVNPDIRANAIFIKFELSGIAAPTAMNYISIQHTDGTILMQGEIPSRDITDIAQQLTAVIKL